MPTTNFQYLTPTEVEWLKDQYDTVRRRLLVPSTRAMISHYCNSYFRREFHHLEAGTRREVEAEIEKVILDIQVKERR